MASLSRRKLLGLSMAAAVGGCSSALEPAPGPKSKVTHPPASRVLRAGRVRRSDELCQAYALNTKTFYASTVYGHTEAVVDLLDELGVRTVRERATTGTSPGARRQQYAMARLAARGIRWHATVGELDDWSRAEAVTRDVLKLFTDYYLPALDGDLSTLLHSFGGCNEVDGPVVDGRTDPQWAQHARLMQEELWRQATSEPLTSDIPVVGPSTRTDVTIDRAEALGDLSAVSDWGNAHLYNAGGSPTRGIDRHLAILQRCFPDAPTWFFTETGYSNSPQDNAGRTVSEDAAATYAIRGICDFFVRDCIYGRFELLDDPDPIDYASQESINRTADRQAHYGLVAMPQDSVTEASPETWRKKPEFYATQRFLGLMSDPGTSWTPEQLDLTVTGGGSDLQQALVQKRNGRHYLLLWRDVEVATTYPDARKIDVPASTVTVKLPYPRPVAIYSPRVAEAPVRTQPPRGGVTLDIDSDLVVVEIG